METRMVEHLYKLERRVAALERALGLSVRKIELLRNLQKDMVAIERRLDRLNDKSVKRRKRH